jgi:hypothetical protein
MKKLAGRLTAFGVLCAGIATVAAAETCYQDASGRIVTRRLPGFKEVPCPAPAKPSEAKPEAPGATEAPPAPEAPGSEAERVAQPQPSVPVTPLKLSPLGVPAMADYGPAMALPDRWRIVDMLPGYRQSLRDPYNRNALKADRPFKGDWFFDVGVVSDTVFESRVIPTGVGAQTSLNTGSNGVFGNPHQSLLTETLVPEFDLYKGDTVFRPPDWEFRFTPAFDVNRATTHELGVVYADPSRGTRRDDSFVGVQALFAEKHLRDVSDRYDFDSVRVGIQPFSADFRGFLFQDDQLGVRLFGTRANNRYQYNLAYFRRIEKDTNSGLNDLGVPLRHDDVFVANVYRQDTFVDGFTLQGTVVYNRNREDGETHYDKNGFLVRPAPIGHEAPFHYDVVYLGLNGDGHFGRLNLTSSVYTAVGSASGDAFVQHSVDILGFFGAAEVSYDIDWLRPRLSLLYASGDDSPYGGRETGFDAILENPQFAGADASYWIRQSVPLIGGGGVAVSPRNGILNDLRSSKDEGQSNFDNPGTILIGVGADADLLPTLRLSGNVNSLFFENTAVLEALRNQGNISRSIGWDTSVSAIYRPLMSQNIVLRASYARLFTGAGFRELFPNVGANTYMLNVVLAY